MACPRTNDAAPYLKQFTASVNGAVIHTEFGVIGKLASMGRSSRMVQPRWTRTV
jgi:hypothetical protein